MLRQRMLHPFSKSLENLPNELLDQIVNLLDEPSDLLPLALASSRFCSIIIPRHLHYRHIRCSAQDGLKLWDALSKDKSLARNVRSLQLQLSPPLRIPPIYTPSLDDVVKLVKRSSVEKVEAVDGDDERALLKGLKNMVNLAAFRWTMDHAHLQTVPLDPENGDRSNIWTVLSTLPTLREVEVHDYGTTKDPLNSKGDSTVRCFTGLGGERSINRLPFTKDLDAVSSHDARLRYGDRHRRQYLPRVISAEP